MKLLPSMFYRNLTLRSIFTKQKSADDKSDNLQPLSHQLALKCSISGINGLRLYPFHLNRCFNVYICVQQFCNTMLQSMEIYSPACFNPELILFIYRNNKYIFQFAGKSKKLCFCISHRQRSLVICNIL